MNATAAKSLDLTRLLADAQLPALPHSAIKIMEMSRNSHLGPAEFAVVIEADPGLTGQVLRFVNSSYFGFSNEISNVKLAIALVGVRTVKNFALWSAVFSLMPNPRCGPFDLKSLWQDSLRRGLLARAVVKLMNAEGAEEAFSAALLQDMAVPLLAKELPGEYAELIEHRAGGEQRLSDLERERFGWTHAEAGGLMARQWRLPGELARLVEGHVRPTGADPATASPLQMAVSLSALLPSSIDDRWLDCQRFEQQYALVAPAEAPATAELLARIDGEFAEFAPVLKLRATSQSLVDYLRAPLGAN